MDIDIVLLVIKIALARGILARVRCLRAMQRESTKPGRSATLAAAEQAQAYRVYAARTRLVLMSATINASVFTQYLERVVTRQTEALLALPTLELERACVLATPLPAWWSAFPRSNAQGEPSAAAPAPPAEPRSHLLSAMLEDTPALLKVGKKRYEVDIKYLEDLGDEEDGIPFSEAERGSLDTLTRRFLGSPNKAGKVTRPFTASSFLSRVEKDQVQRLAVRITAAHYAPGTAILIFVAGKADIEAMAKQFMDMLGDAVWAPEVAQGGDEEVAAATAGWEGGAEEEEGAPPRTATPPPPAPRGPAAATGAPPPRAKFRLCPLHSKVVSEDQDSGFSPGGANAQLMRVIIATAIAESSITIPRLFTVVDTGGAKSIEFDEATRSSMLKPHYCSQASADQRAGRAGRTAAGTAYRLYPRQFCKNAMPLYDPPEMMRVSLENVVLQPKATGMRSSQALADAVALEDEAARTRAIEAAVHLEEGGGSGGAWVNSVKALLVRCITPPRVEAVNRALERLAAMGALATASDTSAITSLGRAMASSTTDLLVTRMVLMGEAMGLLFDALVFAAVATGAREEGLFLNPAFPQALAASELRAHAAQAANVARGQWLLGRDSSLADAVGLGGHASSDPTKGSSLNCASGLITGRNAFLAFREVSKGDPRIVGRWAHSLGLNIRMLREVDDALTDIVTHLGVEDRVAPLMDMSKGWELNFSTDTHALRAVIFASLGSNLFEGTERVSEERAESIRGILAHGLNPARALCGSLKNEAWLSTLGATTGSAAQGGGAGVGAGAGAGTTLKGDFARALHEYGVPAERVEYLQPLQQVQWGRQVQQAHGSKKTAPDTATAVAVQLEGDWEWDAYRAEKEAPRMTWHKRSDEPSAPGDALGAIPMGCRRLLGLHGSTQAGGLTALAAAPLMNAPPVSAMACTMLRKKAAGTEEASVHFLPTPPPRGLVVHTDGEEEDGWTKAGQQHAPAPTAASVRVEKLGPAYTTAWTLSEALQGRDGFSLGEGAQPALGAPQQQALAEAASVGAQSEGVEGGGDVPSPHKPEGTVENGDAAGGHADGKEGTVAASLHGTPARLPDFSLLNFATTRRPQTREQQRERFAQFQAAREGGGGDGGAEAAAIVLREGSHDLLSIALGPSPPGNPSKLVVASNFSIIMNDFGKKTASISFPTLMWSDPTAQALALLTFSRGVEVEVEWTCSPACAGGTGASAYVKRVTFCPNDTALVIDDTHITLQHLWDIEDIRSGMSEALGERGFVSAFLRRAQTPALEAAAKTRQKQLQREAHHRRYATLVLLGLLPLPPGQADRYRDDFVGGTFGQVGSAACTLVDFGADAGAGGADTARLLAPYRVLEESAAAPGAEGASARSSTLTPCQLANFGCPACVGQGATAFRTECGLPFPGEAVGTRGAARAENPAPKATAPKADARLPPLPPPAHLLPTPGSLAPPDAFVRAVQSVLEQAEEEEREVQLVLGEASTRSHGAALSAEDIFLRLPVVARPPPGSGFFDTWLRQCPLVCLPQRLGAAAGSAMNVFKPLFALPMPNTPAHLAATPSPAFQEAARALLVKHQGTLQSAALVRPKLPLHFQAPDIPTLAAWLRATPNVVCERPVSGGEGFKLVFGPTAPADSVFSVNALHLLRSRPKGISAGDVRSTLGPLLCPPVDALTAHPHNSPALEAWLLSLPGVRQERAGFFKIAAAAAPKTSGSTAAALQRQQEQKQLMQLDQEQQQQRQQQQQQRLEAAQADLAVVQKGCAYAQEKLARAEGNRARALTLLHKGSRFWHREGEGGGSGSPSLQLGCDGGTSDGGGGFSSPLLADFVGGTLAPAFLDLSPPDLVLHWRVSCLLGITRRHLKVKYYQARMQCCALEVRQWELAEVRQQALVAAAAGRAGAGVGAGAGAWEETDREVAKVALEHEAAARRVACARAQLSASRSVRCPASSLLDPGAGEEGDLLSYPLGLAMGLLSAAVPPVFQDPSETGECAKGIRELLEVQARPAVMVGGGAGGVEAGEGFVCLLCGTQFQSPETFGEHAAGCSDAVWHVSPYRRE